MLLKLFPDPLPHTYPPEQISSPDEDSKMEIQATSRYINQITKLTDELLCYVYQLEQTDCRLSEQDLVNLLDDLDATNSEHFKHTANHWTNVRDWPRDHGFDRYAEGGNCNFMALAVQCRLLRYVRSELNATSNPIANNDKQQWRKIFSQDFPTGAVEVRPPGRGSLNIWFALRQSIVHQLPGVSAPEPDELQTIYNRLARKRFGPRMGNSDTFFLDLIIVTAQTYLAQFHKQRKVGLVYPDEDQRQFPCIPPQSENLSSKNVLWIYCDNKDTQSLQDTNFCGLRRPSKAESPTKWNDGQSPHSRHSPRPLHKKGRPLLDYALRPRRVTPLDLPYHLQQEDSGVEPEMVQLLVEEGADVNAKVHLNDGMTVFALFVVSCYEVSRMHDRLRVELVQKWYRSACILLKNGAKLDGIGFVDNGRAMKTEDLLVVIFGKKKAADLKDLSLAYVPPQPAWVLWAMWGYHLLLDVLGWISLGFWGFLMPPSMDRL